MDIPADASRKLKKKLENAYKQFPLQNRENTCLFCKKGLVPSKIGIILYNGINSETVGFIETIHFCNSCQIPYMTKKKADKLAIAHPGFHAEVFTAKGSLLFTKKRVKEDPGLIENIPKGNFIYIRDGREEIPKENYRYVLHDTENLPVFVEGYKKNGLILLDEYTVNRIKSRCKEYIFAPAGVSLHDFYPPQRALYLLNLKQYDNIETCPACFNARVEKTDYLFMREGSSSSPIPQKKSIKMCPKCQTAFGRGTGFDKRTYCKYNLQYDYFAEETYYTDAPVVLKIGDFLTRHNLSFCKANHHSMEDIKAQVEVVTKSGEELTETVPAVRCNTCGKLFLLEKDYQNLIKKGIPLCQIVENEYWRAHPSNKEWNPFDAKGSVMFLNGYNVNINQDLTKNQRHKILSKLVESGVVTKAEICSHLDMLIKRAENQPKLENVVRKWVMDREFAATLPGDEVMDVYRVRSIKRKVIHNS